MKASIEVPMSYLRSVWVKKTLASIISPIASPVQRPYTAGPIKPRKAKAEGAYARRFVDLRKVRVVAGSGGNGCLSFLRLFKNEFGGPDGGNGGNGGHVIFKSALNLKSLNHVKPEICADSGVKGRNTSRHGKDAEHLYIEVPLGSIVRDMDGQLLCSLEKDGDIFVAARGGAGGKGNQHFASSEDTIPRYAEEGAPGENKVLYVELKTMAHAGLIGFPNAGKSTLLRAISRARPKVAAYPFTTIHPHVGMVEYEDLEQVAVADIPGLIPDAHKNRGLGISFLRHIERCSCLLYVLDLSADEPWTQLQQLKYELDQYQPGLSQRPQAVIANKMDLEAARKNFLELRERVDLPVFPVSAEKRLNLKPLLVHLRELYDKHGQKTGAGW